MTADRRSMRIMVAALFLATTVPRLAHRGMFVDGVTYATVARNLAEGRGTFWTPYYTATVHPRFHEHPPLGFWMQSLWFRAFGDHLAVERVYTWCIGVLTALLIVLIWRRSVDPRDSSSTDWLPVLFWIAPPVVTWTIAGNLLETTVALFAAASVLPVLIAFNARSTWHAVGLACLSGGCVAAGALTKGPVGLFVLVSPLVLGVGRASWRRLSIVALVQWGTVALLALLLVLNEEARQSLASYAHEQVLAALAGRREIGGGRYRILLDLIQGVWLPMAGVALMLWLATAKKASTAVSAKAVAHRFLLLGLAGSLPILVSTKQTGHYLVPAVPYFALAAAAYYVQRGKTLVPDDNRQRWAGAPLIVAALATVFTLVASVSSSFGRDRELMRDLDQVAARVPEFQTIGICPVAQDDWNLHAWFERRFHTSLAAPANEGTRWMLRTDEKTTDCPPDRCVPVTDPTRRLVLLECR